MKISYNWLQTFFAEPLPSPHEVADLLTFHSSEVEEVVACGNDTVMDVKVLPDKSAWLLSHRGVARELAVILGRSLTHDPLKSNMSLPSVADTVALHIATTQCDYYSVAFMNGISAGPSPQWLVDRLVAIGQRPINMVVDVANYVMLEMGQPLHTFDAEKFGGGLKTYAVGVRQARDGERLVSLANEVLTLSEADTVIVDGSTDAPIALAGVKGGISTAVDEHTTTLLIEAAHFNRVAIRNTARRHQLSTDAAKRYEHGVPRGFAPPGLRRFCALLQELSGGEVLDMASVGERPDVRSPVSVSFARINAVLGVRLSRTDVESLLKKTGYQYHVTDTLCTVTPPLERDDLVIAEDVIEDIGRWYGLAHITSVPPEKTTAAAVNARHYYSERVRRELVAAGFSEVMTSSFRDKDIVKIKNALAADKGFLRSGLSKNLAEALALNVPHRDLLGLSAVQLFEIGTVFLNDIDEAFHIGLAVRSGSEYKAKSDDSLLRAGKEAVERALGVAPLWLDAGEGVSECSLSDIIKALPTPGAYEHAAASAVGQYRPYSSFPSITRDIAAWFISDTSVGDVAAALRAAAGPLCVRHGLFDTFSKNDRVSYAFRFVFQAPDRTLTSGEVESIMSTLVDTVVTLGGEVR